jgi:hypothetical protein
MKDFFRVMGKAFAVVFGSTFALALVLVLLTLAMRPVLRSWVPVQPTTNKHVVSQASPDVLRLCAEFDEKGQCVTPGANEWNLSLSDCSKDGCFVYSRDIVVGYIWHEEFTRAHQRYQPGFAPINPNDTTPNQPQLPAAQQEQVTH